MWLAMGHVWKRRKRDEKERKDTKEGRVRVLADMVEKVGARKAKVLAGVGAVAVPRARANATRETVGIAANRIINVEILLVRLLDARQWTSE